MSLYVHLGAQKAFFILFWVFTLPLILVADHLILDQQRMKEGDGRLQVTADKMHTDPGFPILSTENALGETCKKG